MFHNVVRVLHSLLKLFRICLYGWRILSRNETYLRPDLDIDCKPNTLYTALSQELIAVTICFCDNVWLKKSLRWKQITLRRAGRGLAATEQNIKLEIFILSIRISNMKIETLTLSEKSSLPTTLSLYTPAAAVVTQHNMANTPRWVPPLTPWPWGGPTSAKIHDVATNDGLCGECTERYDI